MAKKKVKKAKWGARNGTGPTITPIDNALEINQIVNEIKELKQANAKTNSRFDRLVDAIDKSKKIRGI